MGGKFSQRTVSMRDEMSPNRAADKVETFLPYPSPPPSLLILVLPVASYF